MIEVASTFFFTPLTNPNDPGIIPLKTKPILVKTNS